MRKLRCVKANDTEAHVQSPRSDDAPLKIELGRSALRPLLSNCVLSTSGCTGTADIALCCRRVCCRPNKPMRLSLAFTVFEVPMTKAFEHRQRLPDPISALSAFASPRFLAPGQNVMPKFVKLCAHSSLRKTANQTFTKAPLATVSAFVQHFTKKYSLG